MKYYTKEWHELADFLGFSEMFVPVIDKESYSDSDIEDIYTQLLDKRIEEERAEYDEPPFSDFDDDYDDPDEFDPEDYLIGDIDEDGEEHNLRHPESYEELLAYQKMELEYALQEYENRPPFDEEEIVEEFEEEFRDNLEEPDEDIPQWIRDAVDPRLVALYALPEKIYEILKAEEEVKQERFDELDAAADDAIEKMYDDMPEDHMSLLDDFDELDGDCVIELREKDGDIDLVFSSWDEDGENVKRVIQFEDAKIIENEGLSIVPEVDEDGDIVSDCDLMSHELYYNNDRFEVHLLFDNDGLKYLTLSCAYISITQENVN